MILGVVGLSYRTASLALREKLAFSQEQVVEFVAFIRNALPLQGVVMVSTCNRTELYFCSDSSMSEHELVIEVRSLLMACRNVDPSTYDSILYTYVNNACVEHLCRVTSGLESMVIGEYQILGQVKDSFRLSAENNFLAPVLSRMFHKSFEVGKIARNLYSMSAVSLSAGQAAVELLKNQNDISSFKKILVLGAGKTARTVIQSLVKEDCAHIVILNRDEEKAQLLANEFHATASNFLQLENELKSADCVFVTTASPNSVLTIELTQKAFDARQQSVVLFDLSVPRNIEPSVAEIPCVTLYSIDDLAQQEYNDALKNSIQNIEKEIVTGVGEFMDWLASLSLTPAFELLQQRFNEVLDKRINFMGNRVSETELQTITDTGRYLTDKYLQIIIQSIREASANGQQTSYVDMVNKMLKLSEERN